MPLLGDPITYWIIRVSLIALLLVCGYNISYKDKDGTRFWRWSIPAWIAYSLIEGLRYMRGQDYYHYMGDLQGDLFTEYRDMLYVWWLDFFHATGLHFAVGFVFYSAILFYAFLLIVKKFPQTAVWALPLFLIIIPETENLVRQFLATSFIIIGISNYLDGKKICRVVISFVAAYMTHFSALFAIAVFLILVFLKKYRKSSAGLPIIPLAIFSLLYFFWDTSYFYFLTSYLDSLHIDDNTLGASYLDNAERWFSEEGSIALVLGNSAHSVSVVLQNISFLTNAAIVWFGYIAMKNDNRLYILYWFSYLAILLATIGGDIEMYNRFRQWLVYFTPIMYGAIFAYCPLNNGVKYSLIGLFTLRWFIYGTLYQFGQMGYSGCAFIWDM